MPWFSQVLADIGDEQSLQQSLSTFSVHIRRISRILEALAEKGVRSQESGVRRKKEEEEEVRRKEEEEEEKEKIKLPVPSPQSLVLLDEVGAGTDPVEGSALAIALLKYLANHTQLTMASTHFGELKALKYENPQFENASVEFNETTPFTHLSAIVGDSWTFQRLEYCLAFRVKTRSSSSS